MSRKITQNDLQDMFSPMSEAFAREALAALWQKQRQEKEYPMRKKLSVGMMVAIALMIAALATALAFMLPHVFFEKVATMQFESGYYEDWSLKEKLQLLSLMREYEVPLSKDKTAFILDESKPEAEREKALDEIMSERYGVNGRIDVITLDGILIKEKGPMTQWTLEDKAWYTQMMTDSGLLGFDECINSLPGKDDITREKAIEIARKAYIDAFGWAEDALDGHNICVDFSIHRDFVDKFDPYYIVTFYTNNAPEGVSGYMQCDVARDGRVMDSSDEAHWNSPSPAEEAEEYRKEKEKQAQAQQDFDKLVAERGPVQTWTIGQKAAVAAWPVAGVNAFWGAPLETDISIEAAIEAAQKALQEKYPVADELSGYTVWADYVTGINANTGGSITSEGTELPPPPYYIVYFAAPGHAYDISDYAVVVQPQDGYVQYIGGPDRSNG